MNRWIYFTFSQSAETVLPDWGWVVGVQTNRLAKQVYYPTVLSANLQGGGIWGPGGAVAQTDGTLYVSTGNAATTSGDTDISAYFAALPDGTHPGDLNDYFEGVCRLRTSPITGGLTPMDWYQPTWAQALNASDLDFGGCSCLLLPTINGLNLALTGAKDGNIYLLNADNLGHWGNELFTTAGPDGSPSPTGQTWGGEGFKNAAAYFYDRTSGNHFVYVVGAGQPGLACYQVTVSGSTANLTLIWFDDITYPEGVAPPFVTFDPKTGSAIVWVAYVQDNPPGSFIPGPGVMLGYPALGNSFPVATPIYRTDWVAADTIGNLAHFAPITGAGQSIFVGTASGVLAYTKR